VIQSARRAGYAILIVLLTPSAARDIGAFLEGRLAPVRIEQSIAEIERHGQALCWAWINTKVRPLPATDLDVRLFDSTGEVSLLAVYERSTHKPWRRTGAVSADPTRPRRQRYCLDLPPWVGPGVTARVEQTISYDGLWGLWTIKARIPDVIAFGVDPPP